MFSASLCFGAVIYVKSTGNDGNNGFSWVQAKQHVQAGIGAASSGGEVWVASGTYVERITLKEGVVLLGGFSGSGDERDPQAWETILNGNRRGSVVSAPAGLTNATVIDGFTITNGSGSYSNRYGGGVYCANSAPTIVNNIIINNTAALYGGGIISSPALSIPTRLLFVATSDAKVYALDVNAIDADRIVWQYDIRTLDGRPDAYIKSSPAIVRGALYVVVEDGTKRYLYCFK
jgi:hypothetical protein